MPIIPDRLQRGHGRMQSEEAVEIEVALAAARPRDGDASARAVVAEVAVWHDHAQPVHGAALEDGDEDLGPGGPALRVRRADEKARDGAQTEQGQGAALHERAPGAVTVHGTISSGIPASPGRGPRACRHQYSPRGYSSPGAPAPPPFGRREW